VPALDTTPSPYESSIVVEVSVSRAEFVRERAVPQPVDPLSARPDVAVSEN
jgi:hypothetical protein